MEANPGTRGMSQVHIQTSQATVQTMQVKMSSETATVKTSMATVRTTSVPPTQEKPFSLYTSSAIQGYSGAAVSMVTGADGDTWFTAGTALQQITANGTLTTYSDPAFNGIEQISAGSGGAIWFSTLIQTSDGLTGTIGELATTGAVTVYHATIMDTANTNNAFPLTAGPDGDVWFDADSTWVAQLADDGSVTIYAVGGGLDYSQGPIAFGADGAFWFNETDPLNGLQQLGRLTEDGTLTTYTANALGDYVNYLITAPDSGASDDSDVWFASSDDSYSGASTTFVGYVTSSGEIVTYTGSPLSSVGGLSAGPGGDIWFANLNPPLSIGDLTPDGEVSDYTSGNDGYYSIALTAGLGDSLWFIDSAGDQIGEFEDTAACQQVTQPDGSYEFSGCVSEEDDGTVDVTSQQSNLDGINVSASPSDEVTYDDGGSVGDALTSAGDSTLSLDQDGTLIPVYTGHLDDQLTGPLSVPVTDGTEIDGMAASGALTITPYAGTAAGRHDSSRAAASGTATGKVSVKLPPILGGGTGTLSFTSTLNSGTTNVKITAPKLTFMQLFSVSNLTLSYNAPSGTWQITGQATTGGSTSTKFSGSLTYTSGPDGTYTLKKATLSVGAISLAGMVNLSNLNVNYTTGDNWQGTATITQPTSKATETAQVSLGFTGTSLKSGSIRATNVPLFGVFQTASFALNYQGGTWDLTTTTTLSGKGGVSANLTVTDGIVTEANMTLTNVSLQGKITIASAKLTYSASTPPAPCITGGRTVTGTEFWSGSWVMRLPQASSISGVSGQLALADGDYSCGSIKVTGNLPLIDGVFLTSLGGSLTVNPPPTTIAGNASLSFGPMVNGRSLLSATGTLTRTLPGDDTSGSYDAKATLSALNHVLGTAQLSVPGDSSPTTLDLTLGASPTSGLSESAGGVTATVTGTVSGSFSAASLSVNGNTHLSVTYKGHPVLTTGASMAIDNDGMAACGKTSTGEIGFEYVWSTGVPEVLRTSGCTEKGF